MILRDSRGGAAPDAEERRQSARHWAVVFRDCSLRTEMSPASGRACRTLMREQAFKWRLPRSPVKRAQVAGG